MLLQCRALVASAEGEPTWIAVVLQLRRIRSLSSSARYMLAEPGTATPHI